MIEINTFPDQDCFVHTIPLTFGGRSVVSGIGFNLLAPPLVVLSGLESTPLVFSSELARCGFLHQDSKPWGPLRDKGVLHLDADGTLVQNDILHSVAYIPGTSYDATQYMGYDVTLASTTIRATGVVLAGHDATFTHTAVFPSIFAVEHGSVVKADPITYTVSIKWKNDSIFVVEEYMSPFKVYAANGNVVETNLSTGCALFGYLSEDRMTIKVCGPFPSGPYLGAQGTEYYISQFRIPLGSVLPDPVLYGMDLQWSFQQNAYWPLYFRYMKGTGVSHVPSSTVVSYVQEAGLQFAVQTFSSTLPKPYDFGDLGGDVIRNQKHVDANILLTAFDLLRIRNDITSWRRLALGLKRNSKKILSGTIKSIAGLQRWLKRVTKDGASAYLGVSYGVFPTLSDGRKLVDGLVEIANQPIVPRRHHARRVSAVDSPTGSLVSCLATLTVETAPLPSGLGGYVMAGIREFKNFGLFPNFVTLWDFVPYSFIFDWFLDDISNAAEYGDMVVDSLYFPVAYCICSTKRSFSPLEKYWLPLEWGIMGTVEFTLYDRYMTRELPLPSMQTGDGISTQFNHWGEATSLIIQKRK